MNYGVITVEGLGKIKKAEIQVKPLMVFVGPNNSGKTYLMTLLYGLTNVSFTHDVNNNFYIELEKNNINYVNLNNHIQRLISLFAENQYNSFVFDIKKISCSLIESLINDSLKRKKDEFVKYVFNSGEIKIDRLSINISQLKSLELEFKKNENEKNSFDVRIRCDDSSLLFGVPNLLSNKPNEVKMVLEYLIQFVYSCSTGASFLGRNSVYLPSSRSGLLLTYQSVINENFRLNEKYRSITQDNKQLNKQQLQFFTLPMIDFMTFLNKPANQRMDKKQELVVNMICRDLINGRVAKRNNIYKYTPNIEKPIDLEMHLSSGVVTESVPLLSAMTEDYYYSRLFIEEPEMSMHPKLQHLISRVLIQLSNGKKMIAVSTHSDLIINHINNMLRLSSINTEKRKEFMDKYNYNSTDLIEKDKISVFQFRIDTHSQLSEVDEIKAGEFGFALPAFNDEFEKILKESDEITRIMEI